MIESTTPPTPRRGDQVTITCEDCGVEVTYTYTSGRLRHLCNDCGMYSGYEDEA